ncbi:hypothetical protein QBC33DRAFT_515005 [Phialemonium atrogriseum]|uniref:DUF1993 domain-containing protein n=1 Tax=Phialemonium atrogriseum TaxID=1093897 RepID=A0AAJ0C015_9PEZI|nr:uncharacterized protein QBC33DRAFT_515005 [Phialemonium atrogriseum]KAK1767455.1 hypothetical protein QBC33DRAFT_515005 [Phialemonium atrogriseum]
MPATTLHESSFGVLEKITSVLIVILKKAAESPEAASLPAARLYADMHPLTYQVQIISRMVKMLFEKLADAAEPELAELTDPTIADLIARAEKLLALVKTISPDAVNGKEDEPVVMATPNSGTWNMTRKTLASNFIVPNSFFHLQTVYSILRMNGVPLGKADFLLSFAGPPAVFPQK